MREGGETAEKTDSGRSIFSRPDFWFFIITLCGLLLRIEYWREFSLLEHFPFAIGADVMEYDLRAREICRGVIFPEVPEIHAPLYSFFLAFLYRLTDFSIPAVRAVQLLLNWGAYLAFYLLLRKMSVRSSICMIFLAFAMLMPLPLFHQAELISESLLVPLLAGNFWLLYYGRRRKSFAIMTAAGVVSGACVLTHGLMWGFVLAELIWFCWCRRWRYGAAFLCGVCISVFSVIAIKSIHYGKFTGIQENAVFNIWLGHNPDADGGCWMRPGKRWKDHHRIMAGTAEKRGVAAEYLYIEKIFDFYLERPLEFFRLTGKKIWFLLLPWEKISGADPPRLIYRTPLQYYGRWTAGLALFGALYGALYLFIRKKRHNYSDFILLVCGLSLMLVLTVVSGRYRQGMMPGVFMLAAIGLNFFPWKKFWLLPLAAAVFAVGGNMGGGYLPEAASIIGEARLRNDDLDGAEELLSFAGRWIDDPARFDNALAVIAERRGKVDVAEKYYKKAIDGDPYDPAAYLNLGKLYFNRAGMRDEAVKLITRSLELNEKQADAWNFLGIAAFHRRQLPAAVKCFENAVSLEPQNKGYEKNLDLSLKLAESEKKK